jgi:hypothetical protein
MPLNITDIEDSYLNADLFDEWKEEFEKEYWEPYDTLGLVNLANHLSDEELEIIKKLDPTAYMEIIEAKEKADKFQEQKMKEVENASR